MLESCVLLLPDAPQVLKLYVFLLLAMEKGDVSRLSNLAGQRRRGIEQPAARSETAAPSNPITVRRNLPSEMPELDGAMCPSDPRLYKKYAADPAVFAEVLSFAKYLDFDLQAFPDLYWIAEQARSAPIPEAWTEHVDDTGNSYYYNEETQESSWEHPLDGYFKGLYERHKQAPVGSGPNAAEAAQMAQEQRLEGQAEIDLSKCNGTYVSSSSSSSDEGDEDSGVDSDHTMELLPGVSEYVAWDTQPGVKANEDK
eukprot:COSAG06_NODE_6003_length_3160_cov_1.311663_3_plen_255_part_00